jgi:phosphonopyruvate decarboxylase
MHMGSLAINASMECTNFKHIFFKISAHDSVRCQPLLGDRIDMRSIALNTLYKLLKVARKEFEIRKSINEVSEIDAPVLLDIRFKKGFHKDLGRPTLKPIQNKEMFMYFVTRE